MTLKLHLGVNDIPYVRTLTPQERLAGKTPSTAALATTGDVADILEHKYHIMQFFYDSHGGEITKIIEQAMSTKQENIMLGAPMSEELITTSELSAIEDEFKQFLTNKEMDGKIPGVPTKASLMGVSHRFAHPYARRASRPSFIDTGMYSANFKAWVD